MSMQKDEFVKDYLKCTTHTNKKGRYSIKCKLGLWAVDAENSKIANSEGLRYFSMYFNDGEYSRLLNNHVNR